MIPFSRILLCLTLHYLKREKERLSTCINNAFTFNYFCFNSIFFVNYFFVCYSMEYNSMVSIHCLLLYFLYFFSNIFFSFIFIPSINKCNSLCCIQNRHNHERTQKSPTYNCTHPCTPMRLYFFSTAIPFKQIILLSSTWHFFVFVLQIVLNSIFILC